MDFDLTGPTVRAVGLFLFFLLAPLTTGLALTGSLRENYHTGERLLVSLILGLVIVTMLAFLASVIAGVSAATVWLPSLFLMAGSLFFLRRQRTASRSALTDPVLDRGATGRFAVLVFAVSLIFFWIFSDMVIGFDDRGLSTWIIDNWGDLPFHLGIVTSFLNGGPVPPPNPSLAGQPLVYPFLADFFSAMLMAGGLPLEQALELPTLLMNAVSMTLLFYLGYRLVRHRGAAALAPLLFVLAGGLGFLWFLSDVYTANQPVWEMVQHLPHRYTSLSEHNIRWINPTLAHLIPQRSLLFGFPLMLSALILLWQQDGKGNPVLAAVMAGMLPFSHMHTFMALMMVTGLMAIASIVPPRSRAGGIRYWLRFFGITTLIAAPQLVFFLLSRVEAGSVIRFEPGWMAEDENILWFWLKNTGVILPLLATSLLFRKRLGISSRAVKFYLPVLMLLVIGNVFLFSPLAYDTNKIFVFSFMIGMPFIALLLVRMFRSRSWWVSGLLFRTLFVTLIFSGSLNLIHELQGGGWPEYTTEELDLAKWLKRETAPDAVFLTAPVHNNVLTLAGRQVVLGYPPHVYSHGVDPDETEATVRMIYSGVEGAEEELARGRIGYVVVGPHERSAFGDDADWFEGRYPELIRSGEYTIYTVGDHGG